MTQAFNTGFRVWKPGKVDLPKIELFLYEVTFVLKEIGNRFLSNSTWKRLRCSLF